MKLRRTHILQFLGIIIFATILSACIKNDIPYPRVHANFLAISAEGQTRAAVIDSINRNVTLYFGEQTDIQNVKIDNYKITDGATVEGANLNEPIDLSKPLKVNLHLYQDWTWTLTGIQEAEYYFTINGQIGSSAIDVPGRRIIAYISNSIPLNSVLVESMKLGSDEAVYSPNIVGQHVDFSTQFNLDVTLYGRTSTWTIYIKQTEATVTTTRADAWTNVAWVYGQAEAGKDNGIEYRKKGEPEWTRATADQLTINGGSFHARLVHLTASTTYETRAYSNGDFGEVLEFTTGEAIQVPNSGFDDWWLDGKIWDPWPQGGEQYWDTGNKGATTLGSSNSVPTDDTATGKGQAAKLETRFVGIGVLGKLAAGNIFLGRYVRTDGTNGVLSFGRPFANRPTKMTGYLKYKTAPINYVADGFEHMSGQPDTCTVWVALIDQDEPFEIRTNPKNRQLFDPDGSYVVAYGKIEFGRDVPEYTRFEFELNYKSTQRKPKYVIITASASKYGDFFTGGDGAVLYVDDLELLYDY